LITLYLRLKREGMTEGWGKLHNEELHHFYSSLHIAWVIRSRKISWAGCVTGVGETRNAYRILVEQHEENEPLGKRNIDGMTIKTSPKEIGWEGLECIILTHNRDNQPAVAKTVNI
jgi:hypothetical protein